ncbi:MAG: phytoene desaturase [Candidatus Obscuribacterales bacterium]|nr:phytoene desaturase [Candidatus Obscuribacterales bacterium]
MLKAIVIGAGFGGLASALRLRKKGYEVLVLDKLDKHGGRGYVYERGGFTYDAGPSVITAPFLIEELFALFDKQMDDYIELVPVEPWYHIRFDCGARFDYSGSLQKMISEVERFCPSDVKGYQQLLEKCRTIFEVGFLKLGDQPFSTLASMIKLAPEMIRLESYLTVHQLISRYIKDERLRQVFSFHPLLVGGNPFSTTSIYSLIHFLEREYGVWYAMGGTGAIVKAIVDLMDEVGVQSRLECTVSKIIVDRGKAVGIETRDGHRIQADLVVANADAPFVYKYLIPKNDRKKWTNARIEQVKFSMGLFVLYFGTNKRFVDVNHHTILFGPRYRDLLEEIFNKKTLAEDFSLYLHRPSRTDPSIAPPGHDCFYVLAPVPNLQGNVEWSAVGEEFAGRILAYLERTVLPDLRNHIVDRFFVTPEHFRDNLLSHHGSGFSVQPTLFQSAYFRFHNKSEDVENLYFVGAGTHPGAGLPGVLTSAKVVDRLVSEAV